IKGGIAAVRKIVSGIAGIAFAVTLGIGIRPVVAHAAKVDCSKVMSELNSGKKASQVAGDLKISTSSVYRCRRRAKASSSSTAATGSPMAAPSTAHAGSMSH
ncbi:MAG TPA: hypothetical protein VJ728_05235, partial [Candidatus Binataceae bacterium]|nr:hypothetical protein [Candidatus Binataceae bacterium]